MNADIKLDPDRNLRDVNALANDASIRNRIRENSGAESRLGDSALDVSLLHADKYFNLDRDALGREYSAEEAARKDIQARSAGLADKETDRKYQVYRDRIKSLLGNEKTRIQAGGENAMDKYNRAAVANASDAVKKRAAEKAALAEAGLDASGDNYDSADEKYFNPSGPSTAWEEHVSADDSAKWGRIMGLLGGGGPASLSGSKFGKSNNDLGFQKESYLADQRARKAAIDASIGSTGITERAIPRAEDPTKAAAQAAAQAASEAARKKAQSNPFYQDNTTSPIIEYSKAERALLDSQAAKDIRTWDPTRVIPDKFKQESPEKSINRAFGRSK